MRRKTWDVGNVFSVELSDGSYTIGQVVGREAEVLNSITCAFYNIQFLEQPNLEHIPKLNTNQLIACQFTTKDLLTKRIWKVFGNRDHLIPLSAFPHEDCRHNGWIGAEMHGSGIMVQFLEAYYALSYWDDWYDPHYLDTIIWSKASKPKSLKFKMPHNKNIP